MFKILKITLYALSIIIFLSLNINIALSQKQYSKEEIIKNARIISVRTNMYNCFYLKSIKLEKAGFITLHFKHNNFSKQNYQRYHTIHCPENILYDVTVFNSSYKPSKIIGAKGVNGRKTNKDFWIQVSPDTASIRLSILKSKEVRIET